jgi:hypothetical protein
MLTEEKTTAKALATAGNKIICKRCTAMSKRSGEQCGRPALKGKAVCDFHGGRSTGPRTEGGKARQVAAVTTSGRYTKEAIEGRRRSALVLTALEDAMYVLNMTPMPRTRGRKPLGYVKLQTVEDVVRFALDNPLHLPDGSGEHRGK